jgi:hypothetical protein
MVDQRLTARGATKFEFGSVNSATAGLSRAGVEHTSITDRGTGVVKAQKPKARTKAKNEHTWRVSRTNNQWVDIRADALSIMDGDLVFTQKGVPVRIIAADTYTDVELIAPADD